MRSRLSLILGLFLAVGAFVALLLLGQVLNPTPYQVTVVIKEVAPGEQLRQDMIATDPQSVDPKIAAEYVLANEADDWMGATIVDSLHPGQPLLKANLVREGHPRADRRLSLALDDGDKVAMVIPVDAEIAPQDIRTGDRVDVVYGVGRVREQTGAPPTAPWLEPDQDLVGSSVVTTTASWRAPDASLTPTPMPQIDFPFAKVILQNLEVVAVIHDERPNPAYGGPQSDEPSTLQGDVKALQVVLPREHAEMMHYGVTTGDYRIALLSPNAPEEGDATLGMTWKDLEAFFWAQRETALGAITGTLSIDGPGAAALVGTPQPTPMAPLTETSPVSITTPREEEVEDSAPDDDDNADSTPEDSPDASLSETSDSTDSDSADTGESDSAEDSDAEESPKQQETQDTADDQSAEGNLDNLGGLVSASMLRGIVCLGGGLLLAAVVVFAGIRVFRKLKPGGE